jgi:hypothetical protein
MKKGIAKRSRSELRSSRFGNFVETTRICTKYQFAQSLRMEIVHLPSGPIFGEFCFEIGQHPKEFVVFVITGQRSDRVLLF